MLTSENNCDPSITYSFDASLEIHKIDVHILNDQEEFKYQKPHK